MKTFVFFVQADGGAIVDGVTGDEMELGEGSMSADEAVAELKKGSGKSYRVVKSKESKHGTTHFVEAV